MGKSSLFSNVPEAAHWAKSNYDAKGRRKGAGGAEKTQTNERGGGGAEGALIDFDEHYYWKHQILQGQIWGRDRRSRTTRC